MYIIYLWNAYSIIYLCIIFVKLQSIYIYIFFKIFISVYIRIFYIYFDIVLHFLNITLFLGLWKFRSITIKLIVLEILLKATCPYVTTILEIYNKTRNLCIE